MDMFVYRKCVKTLRMLFCQLNVSASPHQNNALNYRVVFEIFLPSSKTPISTWSTDMLSGTKIAGQLRKNSSGHATQIFAKKSRKFKIPAVRIKLFCKAELVCRLRALKTSISLGTWFLYRIFPIVFSQLEFAKRPWDIAQFVYLYTGQKIPKDNRCAYHIDNQYCWLLNILGDTSFSGIKRIV